MSGKSRVTALLCVAVVACIGAASAFAGETNGKGEYINGSDAAPLNGKSACAYSGQNPEALLPQTIVVNGVTVPNPAYEPGRTQSWGQIPKAMRDFLTSIGFNPGISCNPTKAQPEPS
jgi:hypothetical protein